MKRENSITEDGRREDEHRKSTKSRIALWHEITLSVMAPLFNSKNNSENFSNNCLKKDVTLYSIFLQGNGIFGKNKRNSSRFVFSHWSTTDSLLSFSLGNDVS